MILPVFIIVLMVSGILAWIAERWNPVLSRWISLLALVFNLATAVLLWNEQPYLLVLSQCLWMA
jgi:NADH-quinone oxidoreductase subunit M